MMINISISKTAEELAAGWDAADIERMRKEGLDV